MSAGGGDVEEEVLSSRSPQLTQGGDCWPEELWQIREVTFELDVKQKLPVSEITPGPFQCRENREVTHGVH